MKQFIHILSLVFIFTSSLLAQKILTLDEAISIALRESHTIKSAQYSLMSSQKNLESIRLGLMTSVNLELDVPKYSRTLSSQFNPSIGTEEFFKIGNTTLESRLYFTQPIIFTNGTLSIVGSMFGRDQFSEVKGTTRDYFSNLSLRLRQPLFTFNTQKANLERAELNLEKARRNYTKAEMDLIYNVTSSFYDLYQLKENVKITEEKVNQTELSYKTASNKFKAGLIAEVEAMQLEVDLVTAKNELLSAQMRYEEEKDNFKLLIGLPLTDEIDIQAEISYKPVNIDTALAIDNALKNRPELLNSETEIKLSEMTVDEVDSKGNIRADLVANYGINKNDERFKNIFNQFDENRSVTLTFSLPIWDWGKNSREVESAEASLNLQKLIYSNQKELIKKEIISAINKLNSAKARVEVLSKSVEVAQKSYDISLSRFQSGSISSFDLSQMQLRLTNAKLNNLSALIDYKLALADLKRKTLYDFENR